MYENIYGLSCVENHILALLKSKDMNISHLYNDSAMSLREIFYNMVVMGKKQEYFDGIPRIQEILKKLDAISLTLKIQPNMQAVRYAIRSCRDNEYILMKVTSDFTKNMLLARGLRDDHYVIVKADSNAFLVQNDIPEKSIRLTARELTKVYGGDYLKLVIKRDLTKDDEETLWKNRMFLPENNIPFSIYVKAIIIIPDLGVKLRNLTGVYKTLRYRMTEYYDNYTDMSYIHDFLPEIEKCYALFEYYNLKKNTSMDMYISLLNRINKMEMDIQSELMRRLHKTEGED